MFRDAGILTVFQCKEATVSEILTC